MPDNTPVMPIGEPSTPVNIPNSTSYKFPIVGIGASAGGLEALEQFLANVPDNSGIAYVVVQHLDPTQKGMLPELLQRVTRMKVHQVKEKMTPQPDNVYVIPPNATMSILNGKLHLAKPIETRGMRLPIDNFLQSLADELKEKSIGLILSGMGSDGSLGLSAIKERNGVTMVQDPLTAKYDSMPRNAIDAVHIDITGTAESLPSKLLSFLKQDPDLRPENETEIKDLSALQRIIILLRTHTGNDFSMYKKNTIYRRIERRMGIYKIDRIASYVSFLEENPKEVEVLFKELLIGVTNFFRDPLVWEKLGETVIPEMVATFSASSTIRVWVPGCSTGEEAYSLAILFKEALLKISPGSGISVQIFATDLDNEAIEIARKGIFPANITSNVSPDRLKRFFRATYDCYQINTEIREMIVFAKHNVVMNAPFNKVDFISCRNLLIYLDGELQKKIFGLFYNSLNPNGILLLGNAETLGTFNNFFNLIDAKLKIFKRAVTTHIPDIIDIPSSFKHDMLPDAVKIIPPKVIQNIQILADQVLLHQFSPPGVLVNDKGDIIYISGRTGKYLEPAVGKANLNIFAMLREGLRNEFPIAFRQAITKKESVTLHNLKVGTNRTTQTLNLKIHWIDKPALLNGMLMIIFSDVSESITSSQTATQGKQSLENIKLTELEKELQDFREEMSTTSEEMQTSQEELKSTNEELQSSNEELQSTNEELTSSKEEMQSLNEELQTVNAELQAKIDQFSLVSNDMKNLLNSTEIATLFLDKELNIRRFTNQATKIFKLRKSDIGRPFTDQVSDLIYPGLVDDAYEVLQTLIFIQKEIPTKDNRWFSVRIMPYRTLDDRIDGLVITFFNISDHKQLESDLNEKEQWHNFILSSSSDIIIKLSTNWAIEEFNPKAEIFFGKNRKDVLNKNFIQLFVPDKMRKKTEKEMSNILSQKPESGFRLKVIAGENNAKAIDWSVTVLLNNFKVPTGIILITK